MRSTRVSKPKSTLYAQTGQLIRAARKAKGWTQEQLAAEVDLSRTSITNIERGRQKLFLDTLWTIAGRLGVPVTKLIPEGVPSPLEERMPKGVSTSEVEWIKGIMGKGRRST